MGTEQRPRNLGEVTDPVTSHCRGCSPEPPRRRRDADHPEWRRGDSPWRYRTHVCSPWCTRDRWSTETQVVTNTLRPTTTPDPDECRDHRNRLCSLPKRSTDFSLSDPDP